MRWVSYTRSISSRIGEENPANTIAEQNANIEQYLKIKGTEYQKSTVTARDRQKQPMVLIEWCKTA